MSFLLSSCRHMASAPCSYNKTRPDFGSTPDWYDYQELVEDKSES